MKTAFAHQDKIKPSLLCLMLIFASACGQQNNENQQQSNITTGDNLSQQAKPSTPSKRYPQHVFWGDTHLHTSNSVDAFGFGNRLDTEAALRFARGEQVTSTKGVEAQLSRPLDFLVISDHSGALGATKELYEAPRLFVRDPLLREWWDRMHESEEGSLSVTAELIDRAARGDLPETLTDTESQNKRIFKLWKEHNKIIDRYNEPGTFSAFVGFEYTPMPNGNNLHRVVMFRDGAKRTNTVLPFSSIDNPDPEQLWAWMDQYQNDTGGKVLAMPHNSNVSNGLMFAMQKLDGSPIDEAYAKTRAKFEPVVEVTQIKGDSESHPFLSPNDEFADYGIAGWDHCNLSCTEAMDKEDYAGSYVREALKRGLQLEKETGVNPFAFGLIGSTDSHTSLATADEDNYYGKHTGLEINVKDRALKEQSLGKNTDRFGWHYLSSGYAAAWATENSREAIFDAFNRREVYATTGPRMSVRFFGGTQFSEQDALGDIAETGYEKGVPMGGTLSRSQVAPMYLVSALMDPQSANLDRIQIIKGWIDDQGETHEKVYDVQWSDKDNRPQGEDGKVPAVGNTVDLKNGTWENSIGATELTAFWQDPDFDPEQSAFYYARVLEIPTPTWQLIDSVKNGIELLNGTPRVQQERAYTSPIWYQP